jgi:hypothetical protein
MVRESDVRKKRLRLGVDGEEEEKRSVVRRGWRWRHEEWKLRFF